MTGQDGEVLLFRERLQTEGSRRGDRGLQLLVVVVVGAVAAEGDDDVRAAGLLELADHEGAGAGGRAPVDVSPVVPRDVLPQRVEGEVGGGDVPGGLPLEVVQESGRG